MENFIKVIYEDATIIGYLFNYNINNGVVGFPKESLYKVINTLNRSNLSVIEVLDENNYKEYRANTKAKTNKYSEILNKAGIEIELKNKLNNIIKIIENKLRNKLI